MGRNLFTLFLCVTAIDPDIQESQNSSSTYVRNSCKKFHENSTDRSAIHTRLDIYIYIYIYIQYI